MEYLPAALTSVGMEIIVKKNLDGISTIKMCNVCALKF